MIIRKFSGTEAPGDNKDLAGKTCDAFAHFSLEVSSGNLVLVDVQGMLSCFQGEYVRCNL